MRQSGLPRGCLATMIAMALRAIIACTARLSRARSVTLHAIGNSRDHDVGVLRRGPRRTGIGGGGVIGAFSGVVGQMTKLGPRDPAGRYIGLDDVEARSPPRRKRPGLRRAPRRFQFMAERARLLTLIQ